jgi:hypothetical protein
VGEDSQEAFTLVVELDKEDEAECGFNETAAREERNLLLVTERNE